MQKVIKIDRQKRKETHLLPYSLYILTFYLKSFAMNELNRSKANS